MIIKKAEFMISAVNPSQYPDTGWPEIALAGRSNVGKSSLINTLVNRKSLARVGNTPGKTRVINFYNINDSLMLVDLPGYGYAKVSKEERKSWGLLAETYLNTRQNLNIILLLVDMRHDPTGDDILMLDYIKRSKREFAVVATKSDKVKRSEHKKNIDNIRRKLNLDDGSKVIPFSSLKRTGAEEIWSVIETFLE
ncbi:MAG: YihA family ribosome biogenesis GTP-binding protein [Clostridiaceae bacterium]|jgi:GTP-binding protein|nr:YihA family ribosome biogenesis GTP-binding protein [Clostridiaceae bacterium]